MPISDSYLALPSSVFFPSLWLGAPYNLQWSTLQQWRIYLAGEKSGHSHSPSPVTWWSLILNGSQRCKPSRTPFLVNLPHHQIHPKRVNNLQIVVYSPSLTLGQAKTHSTWVPDSPTPRKLWVTLSSNGFYLSSIVHALTIVTKRVHMPLAQPFREWEKRQAWRLHLNSRKMTTLSHQIDGKDENSGGRRKRRKTGLIPQKEELTSKNRRLYTIARPIDSPIQPVCLLASHQVTSLPSPLVLFACVATYTPDASLAFSFVFFSHTITPYFILPDIPF